jgi:hypothetical protein
MTASDMANTSRIIFLLNKVEHAEEYGVLSRKYQQNVV